MGRSVGQPLRQRQGKGPFFQTTSQERHRSVTLSGKAKLWRFQMHSISSIYILARYAKHFLESPWMKLRACLHGVGGPQVGEVTRLGWVTRLFI